MLTHSRSLCEQERVDWNSDHALFKSVCFQTHTSIHRHVCTNLPVQVHCFITEQRRSFGGACLLRGQVLPANQIPDNKVITGIWIIFLSSCYLFFPQSMPSPDSNFKAIVSYLFELATSLTCQISRGVT